jgi:hypothetical protein
MKKGRERLRRVLVATVMVMATQLGMSLICHCCCYLSGALCIRIHSRDIRADVWFDSWEHEVAST